jgi:hypothetical protein
MLPPGWHGLGAAEAGAEGGWGWLLQVWQQYRLVVLPAMYSLPAAAVAALLQPYVAGGGAVVCRADSWGP